MMRTVIALGETSSKMHPEADLYIDNNLASYGDDYRQHLGLKGKILDDPSDQVLIEHLDSITSKDVEVVTSLQGRYSLSKIGAVVNYLRQRGLNVTINIEPIPENIRVHIGAPLVELHQSMETQATRSRKLRVFLCHSKSDKPKVKRLYHHLLEQGVEPWFDEENLLPGQDWNEEIRKAIRQSHLVVVCLSQDAVTKTGYVQKEIKVALDFSDEQPEGMVYIVPLKFEECEVPMRLSKWQWLDLYKEGGLDKLKQTLSMRARLIRDSEKP